jgi:hypothetical protein
MTEMDERPFKLLLWCCLTRIEAGGAGVHHVALGNRALETMTLCGTVLSLEITRDIVQGIFAMDIGAEIELTI